MTIMTDPAAAATFGLTSLAIAIAGPIAGPYALIAFAALCGAMWPLSASNTIGKYDGAWLLIRCTLTALLLTAFLATVLHQVTGVDPTDSLPAIALAIGALGNGWRPVFDALGVALSALIGSIKK